MPSEHTFILLALGYAALAAAWDLRAGRIPNTLSYGVLLGVTALALCALVGDALGRAPVTAPCVHPWLGGLSAAALPYALFRAGALGGGDVKLLAGIGALLGPVRGLEAELAAFATAAAFALAQLAGAGRLYSLPQRLRALRRATTPLPSFRFAPAVLAGVALVALEHWSLQ